VILKFINTPQHDFNKFTPPFLKTFINTLYYLGDESGVLLTQVRDGIATNFNAIGLYF